MGVLSNIFKSRDKPQNATSGSAYRFFIDGSSSGKNVNEQFNTFSIYQVLPQLIELWGLNVQTDVEAKKNFVRQTVK